MSHSNSPFTLLSGIHRAVPHLDIPKSLIESYDTAKISLDLPVDEASIDVSTLYQSLLSHTQDESSAPHMVALADGLEGFIQELSTLSYLSMHPEHPLKGHLKSLSGYMTFEAQSLVHLYEKVIAHFFTQHSAQPIFRDLPVTIVASLVENFLKPPKTLTDTNETNFSVETVTAYVEAMLDARIETVEDFIDWSLAYYSISPDEFDQAVEYFLLTGASPDWTIAQSAFIQLGALEQLINQSQESTAGLSHLPKEWVSTMRSHQYDLIDAHWLFTRANEAHPSFQIATALLEDNEVFINEELRVEHVRQALQNRTDFEHKGFEEWLALWMVEAAKQDSPTDNDSLHNLSELEQTSPADESKAPVLDVQDSFTPSLSENPVSLSWVDSVHGASSPQETAHRKAPPAGVRFANYDDWIDCIEEGETLRGFVDCLAHWNERWQQVHALATLNRRIVGLLNSHSPSQLRHYQTNALTKAEKDYTHLNQVTRLVVEYFDEHKPKDNWLQLALEPFMAVSLLQPLRSVTPAVDQLKSLNEQLSEVLLDIQYIRRQKQMVSMLNMVLTGQPTDAVPIKTEASSKPTSSYAIAEHFFYNVWDELLADFPDEVWFDEMDEAIVHVNPYASKALQYAIINCFPWMKKDSGALSQLTKRGAVPNLLYIGDKTLPLILQADVIYVILTGIALIDALSGENGDEIMRSPEMIDEISRVQNVSIQLIDDLIISDRHSCEMSPVMNPVTLVANAVSVIDEKAKTLTERYALDCPESMQAFCDRQFTRLSNVLKSNGFHPNHTELPF